MTAKVERATRMLPVDALRTIAACENYTAVVLAGGERLLVRRTMQAWMRLLPAAQFARVHRGLIANLDALGRTERGPERSTRLHFAGGAPGPFDVKRRHWPALRLRLERWRAATQTKLLADTVRRSIAVLPFVNLSGDATKAVFCDGISEELLNVLAKIPGLLVAARTSSFYFKGRNVPVAEIGRRLGVDYVLEGSVRKAGRRVRITAQLINAADGFHAWSDYFDRDLTDLLAIQDEIAGLIAQRLRLELAAPARPHRRLHPEAHARTLEGRHFWNLRTHEGFVRAERAFTQAQALDPGYAPAAAGLADVCVVRAMYRLADGTTGAADDLQRAAAAARRALELDPTLAEPHATLGFVAFHDGRLDAAEPHFQRAFAANPNYATGRQFFAWTLAARGQLARALAEYDRGIALDPLSFINIDRYAAMLALAGRFADALAANERAAALRPDVFVGNLSQRAPLLLALGRRDEAVAAARAVRATAPTAPYRRNSAADAIFVLRRAGLAAEAADYAAEALALLPADNHLRGFVLAAAGRFDEAWPSLAHTPTILQPFLYWSPLWDCVRGRPAFRALLARLGRMAEYRTARAAVVRH